MIWSMAGAFLLGCSAVLIAFSSGQDARAFNLILLAFAIWTAAGVEAMLRMDVLWRPPCHRISFAVASALPLLLLFTTLSLFRIDTGLSGAVNARSDSPHSIQPLGSHITHAFLRIPFQKR
jgi:hypothetical protein